MFKTHVDDFIGNYTTQYNGDHQYYVNVHFRSRSIGGTYHFFKTYFFKAKFQGISPENMAQQIYNSYILGSWNSH